MKTKMQWTVLLSDGTSHKETQTAPVTAGKLTFCLKVRTHLSGPWASIDTHEVKLDNFPDEAFLQGFALGLGKATGQEPLEIRWNLKGNGQGHYMDIFTEA